jgi:hypothetical protein
MVAQVEALKELRGEGARFAAAKKVIVGSCEVVKASKYWAVNRQSTKIRLRV